MLKVDLKITLSLENAIDVAIDKDASESFTLKVKEVFENFKNKYKAQDENITFEITKLENSSNEAFSNDVFERLLSLINTLPTGVNTWLKEYPDIVESSDNLAIS